MQTISNTFISFFIFTSFCFFLASCSEDTNKEKSSSESSTSDKVETKDTQQEMNHEGHDHSNHDHSKGEMEKVEKSGTETGQATKKDATMDEGSDYIIKMKTNKGDIDIILYDDTPLHKKNFLDLVNKKMYDGQIFHRVIKDFMIQGGGIDMADKTGKYKNRKQIPAEFVKKRFHKKGVLAAARTGDQVNPKRMSSWCQFYIVQGKVYPATQLPTNNYPKERKKAYTTVGGTPHLDDQYTVFGEVLKGLDVVDKIANVKTAPGDKPLQDVIIKSARAVKMSKADIKKKYSFTFM